MATDHSLTRRRFLRAAGVAIALPFMPSLFPARAFAGDPPQQPTPPRRLIFITVPLGFIPNPWIAKGDFGRSRFFPHSWLPETDGAAYEMPAAHEALEPFRRDISFLKGLCHPRYRDDTHHADNVFLTGADTKADPSRAFINTISCDQVAAASPAFAAKDVRYPYLALGVGSGGMGTITGSLSWSAKGTPITPTISAAKLFDRLFGKDDVPKPVRLARFVDRRSVLDATAAQVAELNRSLDAADRRKLDEVTTAVRDIESDIQREEAWLDVPKPKVDLERPPEKFHEPIHDGSADFGSNSSYHVDAMLKLAHAAFLTDSTRVITYAFPDVFADVTKNYKHALAHAGTQQLADDHFAMDKANSDRIAGLLKLLADSKDHDGRSLLHHTCGVYGSGCWGPHHGIKNLPVMCFGQAGGRIKQGEARQFPDPTPLSNLWLTMLRASGVDAPSFSDSTGELAEIKA